MKYKIVGTRGNQPFETTLEELDEYMKLHRYVDEIKWKEYLFDESGNICGLKGFADLGHGYGFDGGWQEFTIRVGETYSFTHEYTSIVGPSDWSTGSFEVKIQLVAVE